MDIWKLSDVDVAGIYLWRDGMDKRSMFDFMVPPSDYSILKYGGEVTRDIEFAIELIQDYLPKELVPEPVIRENLNQYNLENMLETVRGYFKRDYDFQDERIELNNRYQKTVSSYVWLGEKEEESRFLHIDELFESAVLSFLLVFFKWSKDFRNLDTYGFCFLYTLFILNDVSILGELPDEKSCRTLMEEIHGDMQVINLAEDCYWTITAFTIAHEIAHLYLKEKPVKKGKRAIRKEEFDADGIAYDIVLKMIMESRGKERKNRILEEYTYMAPMMYMDYFDLLYYTDYVLYRTRLNTYTHPLPIKRKARLFAVLRDDQYMFDTVDGNHLYGGFLDVYDEYRTQVLLKRARGKLDSIIRPARIYRRGNNDER